MNGWPSEEMKKPLVTVLMPVFNCKEFVGESISSILSQTFSDFELLIVDDASQDGTYELIRAIQDRRIRIVRNSRNLGVAGSLNIGIESAKGEWIARMDADDISVPRRLERQVRFMASHPKVGISGGWIRFFGNGMPYTLRVPETHEEISSYMLFENPIRHMTIMMRKALLDQKLLRYDERFTRSEDYELWTRAVGELKLANLQQVLVRVRRNRESVTLSNWNEVTRQTETILDRMLTRLGLNPTKEEISFHHKVGRGYRLNTMHEVIRAEKWLKDLLKQNSIDKIFPRNIFQKEVGRVWFRSCANSAPLGIRLWRKWRRSPLSKMYQPIMEEKMRFFASFTWHGILKAFQRA